MKNCGVATKKLNLDVAALASGLADGDFHMPLIKRQRK